MSGWTKEAMSPEERTAQWLCHFFAEQFVETKSIYLDNTDVETAQRFGSATGKFSRASYFKFIKDLRTGEEITTWVYFTGALNGVLMAKYPERAAVEVAGYYLKGDPDGPPTNISDDRVKNAIGELFNQAVGGFKQNLDNKYTISMESGTPAIQPAKFRVIVSAEGKENYSYIRTQVYTPMMRPVYLEMGVERGIIVLENGDQPQPGE